ESPVCYVVLGGRFVNRPYKSFVHPFDKPKFEILKQTDKPQFEHLKPFAPNSKFPPNLTPAVSPQSHRLRFLGGYNSALPSWANLPKANVAGNPRMSLRDFA
ncbi:MAG: hypothetical protein IJW99_09340, partial [Clostridia bacterium]|nr:hypothetical protein [Clostridia bacterium]